MSTGFEPHYLYVKVIEAREIVIPNATFHEPYVSIKLNGHEYLHKQNTKCQAGVEWWEQTFRFKIKDVESDWIAVEVRDRGTNLFGSDWIGEVQLRTKEFKDGKVHEEWYKLGKGAWKNHTREPRGFIHLAIQLLSNKYDRPFLNDLPASRKSFETWVAEGMPMRGHKPLEDTTSHKQEHDPENLHNTFELTYQNILEAEHKIAKNYWKILMEEHPSDAEVVKMKKLNWINCLHKGNFDQCKGKKYMFAVDGTASSKRAFEGGLQLVDPVNDHVFIVTVRERKIPDDYFDDKSRIILKHKLWRAAAGIVSQFQEIVEERKIDYTSIMPEAEDARELVCELVKKYRPDYLVIGKHDSDEEKHHSKYFRSFHKYCQKHANCSVITF